MSDDKELIERVAMAMVLTEDWQAFERRQPNDAHYMTMKARRAIAAVRAYDAERRASVLDVDALKTLVWLPDGMPPLSVSVHDPDDYRDPFALVTKMDRAPGIKT